MRVAHNRIRVSIGTIINSLTVMGIADKVGYSRQCCYNCKCVCGNPVRVSSYSLRKGLTKSCGKCWVKGERISKSGKLNTTDYTGVVAGNFKFIEDTGKIIETSSGNFHEWKAICLLCGKDYFCIPSRVMVRARRSEVISCGCAFQESYPRILPRSSEEIKAFVQIERPDLYKEYNIGETLSYKNLKCVEYTCKTHGKREQTLHSFLLGLGCTICTKGQSKMCKEWLDFLKIPKDKDHREVSSLKFGFGLLNKTGSGRPLIFDGYVPETKTVYEFYGDYWHGNLIRYNRNDLSVGDITMLERYTDTLDREKRIKKAGLKLITMWESDWLKLKQNLSL